MIFGNNVNCKYKSNKTSVQNTKNITVTIPIKQYQSLIAPAGTTEII